MKQLTILFILIFSLTGLQLDAKCDCDGNEIIYVCQNGQTKRVNCSALSDPNVFCGPCSKKPNCTPGAKCDDYDPCTKWDKYDNNCNCYGRFADQDDDGVCDDKDICPDGDDLTDKNKNGIPDDCEGKETVCNECTADADGRITICWIPGNKDNMRTVRAECENLKNFFDDEGKLKGHNRCGECECAFIGDTDSDGDGICDRVDECPGNPDKTKAGPCGCDDEDSDTDWVCDKDDKCLGHNDKEDADGDGTPDGCDACPENPDLGDDTGPCGCDDQDSDSDGVCDKVDCFPDNPDLPTAPGTSCDDEDENTENDVITADGCGCSGTIKVCSISAKVSYIICDDHGTPALANDDTYSFNLTVEALENAGTQWEGGFDNAFFGAFGIGPTAYGEQVQLGPFPAGAFTATNVAPPIIFTNGISIKINVNAVGDFSCEDWLVVDSPGTCECDDADGDEVCDEVDICTGGDDREDEDGDGTPDKCDVCPSNPDLDNDAGPCGCDDQDSDVDGICDNFDCAPNNDSLPASSTISCDDGDVNTSDDSIAPGTCDCIGIPIQCPDTDRDGVCNEDDICQGFDDAADQDNDGTPDGCDQCPNNEDLVEKGECGCEECPPDPCDDFCKPIEASSEYEWIEKISINQLEHESGPDGGYADNRHMYIELGQGDSVSFWLFPHFLEDNCEASIHIYADWNGDCDFEDEDELILWKRTTNESGADIAIPYHAKVGEITVRFMLHYGRILSGCQAYIQGEVEDYTLKIFYRDPPQNHGSLKDSDEAIGSLQKSLRIAPNPVIENNSFFIDTDLNLTKPATINIFSLEGVLISTFRLENGQREFQAGLLKAGVYVIELNTENERIKERIIIQK